MLRFTNCESLACRYDMKTLHSPFSSYLVSSPLYKPIRLISPVLFHQRRHYSSVQFHSIILGVSKVASSTTPNSPSGGVGASIRDICSKLWWSSNFSNLSYSLLCNSHWWSQSHLLAQEKKLSSLFIYSFFFLCVRVWIKIFPTSILIYSSQLTKVSHRAKRVKQKRRKTRDKVGGTCNDVILLMRKMSNDYKNK